MQKIKPNWWFFISWVAITAVAGVWQHFNAPPDGMHQGAQADRACVAWNYYKTSMNFLEPRVMENRAADGVAGMEFPVINYVAAVFYKIFGPHEWIYRAIMFIIVSIGVFSVFLITGFFIGKTWSRLILVYSWYLSPIFLFYSNNFIPDPAALSFSMLAIYFFLRFYFHISIQKSILFYLIFISLAGLIKITFLIPHIAILSLFLISKLRPELLSAGFPKLKWHWILLPFLFAIAWYGYASRLTEKTGNIHFLQQMNPAQSLTEFVDNTRYAFNTWHESIYSPNALYIIFFVYLISLLKWRETPFISLFSILLFLGFLGSFVLFNKQYRYHDYYFFLMLPAVFFMLLNIQQTFIEQKKMILGLFPVLVLLAYYYLPIRNFNHGVKMLNARYTPGHYYHQVLKPDVYAYTDFRKKLDSLLPHNAAIISAFDPTPNTTLYFLRRRGIRIADDFSPELTRELLKKNRDKYLIINDSAGWNRKYNNLQEYQLIAEYKMFSVWRHGIMVQNTEPQK